MSVAPGTMSSWCQKKPLILKEEVTILSHAGGRIEITIEKAREENSEHSKCMHTAPSHYFHHAFLLQFYILMLP